MVTTVIIVRHCESTGNLSGRFQGRSDAEVTEMGKKQLAVLSLRFRNEHIDAIYSSPLIRARATADAINEYHHLPVTILEALSEIDVGDLEDLPLAEVPVKYPVLADQWNDCPDLCDFPGGEKMAEVYARARDAFNEIVAENKGKTVAIATHGGVIRNLYAYITYGKPEGIRSSIVFGNTSVSILEVQEDGSFSWKEKNDVSHLPEELKQSHSKYQRFKTGENK